MRLLRFLSAGLVACFGVALGVYAGAAPTDERNAYSGMWLIEQPITAATPVGGGAPPLLPEAKKTYEAHLAALRAGDTSFDSTTWCAGAGAPRLNFMSYPFEIMVRPQRIVFLYEWNHWARVIDMLSPKPLEELPPSSLGVARGRWDGADLVIETTGISDATMLDSSGLPHSENLKLTERWRLLGDDRLENRITIEDKGAFSKPWDVVATYRRQPKDAVIQEDVCLDRVKKGEAAIR